jgi:hypothetical protein
MIYDNKCSCKIFYELIVEHLHLLMVDSAYSHHYTVLQRYILIAFVCDVIEVSIHNLSHLLRPSSKAIVHGNRLRLSSKLIRFISSY